MKTFKSFREVTARQLILNEIESNPNNQLGTIEGKIRLANKTPYKLGTITMELSNLSTSNKVIKSNSNYLLK